MNHSTCDSASGLPCSVVITRASDSMRSRISCRSASENLGPFVGRRPRPGGEAVARRFEGRAKQLFIRLGKRGERLSGRRIDHGNLTVRARLHEFPMDEMTKLGELNHRRTPQSRQPTPKVTRYISYCDDIICYWLVWW